MLSGKQLFNKSNGTNENFTTECMFHNKYGFAQKRDKELFIWYLKGRKKQMQQQKIVQIKEADFMNTEEKKAVIERLEERKIRFRFNGCKLFLLFKARADSKRGKVEEELKKYISETRKFVEEEYKYLVTQIFSSIIFVETAEHKISAANKKLTQISEPQKLDDPRKQKREIARVNSANAAILAEYEETVNRLNEERAFIDTALNIVSRLCLASHHYTFKSINEYLKYVTVPYDFSYDEVTYDAIYSEFNKRIKTFREEC